MRRLLLFLFHQLYHAFAWSYDLVAAVVSLGRWNRWVRTAGEQVRGRRVLELGPGPGHLQCALRTPGRLVLGVDESLPMLRQATRRLRRAGETPTLVRALSQALPCPASCFDDVVATFPAEYIFDPRTMEEVARVLVMGGQLTVLLGVQIPLPGKTDEQLNAVWDRHLLAPARRAGLQAEITTRRQQGIRLLYLLAHKPENTDQIV